MFDSTAYYDVSGNAISREEWLEIIQTPDGKRVAEDTVGEIWVSTVLLGMDYNFSGDGLPIIFETMVFGTDEEHHLSFAEELWCERYATHEEALAGHQRVVASLRNGTFTGYTSNDDQ